MHPFEDLEVPASAAGIHWFGQSTFALKDVSCTIVQIDPYYPRERPAERFIHARPPLHEASLRTDFVLLTHNHGDHTCIESIERIHAAYQEVRFIGPTESIQAVLETGVDSSQTQIVTAGDIAEMGTIKAQTVWAKPPEGLSADEIQPPDVAHLGYVVEVGQTRVYISRGPGQHLRRARGVAQTRARTQTRYRLPDDSPQRKASFPSSTARLKSPLLWA